MSDAKATHYDDTDAKVVFDILQSAVNRMKEKQREKIRAHIGRCTMSVYGTQAECKAARDALERLLDDEL